MNLGFKTFNRTTAPIEWSTIRIKNLKGTVEKIKGEHEKRWAEIRKNLEQEILATREAVRSAQLESSSLQSLIERVKEALHEQR